MKNTNGKLLKRLTKISKHYPVADLNDLTVGYLNQCIAARRVELFRKKWIRDSGIIFDTNKWVIRANPDQSLTVLAPAKL